MAVNERSSLAETDSAREIVATRIFHAPRELVFRMWTEPEHVKQWWGPRGFTTTIRQMDVRPGGDWKFVMHGPDGTDYDNEITYLEVVRPALLRYTHGPAPRFDVTVTFDEEGDRTRVTMRMVFESAAMRDQVAEEFGAVEGMHQTLDRLAEELANVDAFVVSRTFDAPRELVFRVWTERDHLSRWFGPKGSTIFSCTNDLRVGGVMHYGMRTHGMELWGRWVYREITPPARLVFLQSFSDPDGNVTRSPFGGEWPAETLSTITFDERDGQTTVTVRATPWQATDAQRDSFAAMHPSMNGGWSGTFERLAGYLAEVRQ